MLEIFTDGASRGNPGPSASAFIIVQDGKIVKKSSKYLGNATNNVAEYTAIIEAMKAASTFTRDKVQIYSDSQLAIKQLRGEWRVKKQHLLPLYATVMELSKIFSNIEFINVRRTNKYVQMADSMANYQLDMQHKQK